MRLWNIASPLKKLLWRNADLKLGTIDALIDSLEVSPTQENLVKAREADDLMVLKHCHRMRTSQRGRKTDLGFRCYGMCVVSPIFAGSRMRNMHRY